MASPSKRREMDVMKLMMSDYKVETIDDSIANLFVEFHGPPNSLYSGGVWKVKVELPDSYPYKSPSIGFVNRIYHPNIDETSGSVCLDVINQTWSPMFGIWKIILSSSVLSGEYRLKSKVDGISWVRADLLNIFDVFLPQLLLYPNPSDPLNGEAAAFMIRECQAYENKVREHCQRYAKWEEDDEDEEGSDEESDEEDGYGSDGD